MMLHIPSMAGRSPFLNLVVVFLAALAYLQAGCGPGSSGPGGQAALGMVPDSVAYVHVVDMDEVLQDRDFLESGLPDSMILRGFGKLEEKWDRDWGIAAQDIDSFVLTSDGVMILEGLDGRIDFELVEDTLYDFSFEEDDYRGYALWEARGQGVALLEDDGYVIVGDTDDVKRALRLRDQGEGSLLQDHENPLKRALDRAGTGLLVKASPGCGALFEVRRCEAGAVSVSTNSESYTLEHTLVLLFGNERTAERHVEDFEEHLKDVQDSASSLEYRVTQDGEFIEVEASIDWDDLGNCKLLDALLGDRCLIAAKARPPSAMAIATKAPATGVSREETIESGPLIPVINMDRHVGETVTVQGHIAKTLQSVETDHYYLEVRHHRPPHGSLGNYWIFLRSENRHKFPGDFETMYIKKSVCATGSVERAEVARQAGFSIEIENPHQIASLHGDECLIAAKASPLPTPRSAMTVLARRALAMVEETERMGFIPSSKAGDHIGREGTVRGLVTDYQWISGRPGRPHLLLFNTPALVERGSKVSAQENPDAFTVVVWRDDALKVENNFPSTGNFGPNYLKKVVCVTGTIGKDWDDRPSITAKSADQLKVDC